MVGGLLLHYYHDFQITIYHRIQLKALDAFSRICVRFLVIVFEPALITFVRYLVTTRLYRCLYSLEPSGYQVSKNLEWIVFCNCCGEATDAATDASTVF